jgi:hypothetical protein
MIRKAFCLVTFDLVPASIRLGGAGLLLPAVSAEAQRAGKVPRLGFLSAAPSIDPAFIQGLSDLGYAHAKTIVIEHRSADSKLERLPELAAELVDLKHHCHPRHPPAARAANR